MCVSVYVCVRSRLRCNPSTPVVPRLLQPKCAKVYLIKKFLDRMKGKKEACGEQFRHVGWSSRMIS